MRNAIILAAGKSNRFPPFTYEQPKGLLTVRGEVLIERQIRQLQEAGIKDIVVVIGFMKEKYFYLEDKYNVKLLVNNTFDSKGNLYSLYVARDYLADTYICSQDHYFVDNPYLEKENKSFRAIEWKKNKSHGFSVSLSDIDVITDFSLTGENDYAFVGHAYFTRTFSNQFVELMNEEINDFGVRHMFWEEFYSMHLDKLTLFGKKYKKNQIQEFNSVEDLIHFDAEFLNNINSDIVKNISSVLGCVPRQINNIEVIQKGLTNVSFKFTVEKIEYIYRHPGGTADSLIDRQSELYAQKKAKSLEIDNSVIYMDPTGWKLSYYVQNMIPCDLDNSDTQLETAFDFLRILHEADWDDSVKEFDPLNEALKLIEIASSTKGNLQKEFSTLIKKAKRLDQYLKNDGYREVALCHNDTYAPNYLVTEDNKMYLIDWEYAGINDKAHDIGCICSRYDYTDEEINRFLESYFKRKLTYEEHRHYIGSIALAAFYWFAWGLYKGSVNDDDGFFFLPAYRNFKRYIDVSLKSYGE